MPTPEKYLAKLEEGNYYHVYNHASGSENLFKTEGNYRFFLQKLDEHLSDYIEILAFCLMPNHFHTLIRVKTITELSSYALGYLISYESLNDCICRKYNNFFIAYSMAFNKQQKRKGNLFCKPFKRIIVDKEEYFTKLIHYIHYNPVHHGFVKEIHEYKWTSYQRYLIDKPSKLPKEMILEWFGGKEKFIAFHSLKMSDNFSTINEFIIEEN